VAALALLAAPLFAAAAPPEEPDLGWLDREALAAREIQVRTRRDGPTVIVEVVALIDASPAAIWDVLTACEIAPEYVSNIVSCERLEVVDGGRAELFVQTVKPAFFIPRFEQVFRLDYEPYERIDVLEVSGPLERMEGRWWFLPGAGGTVMLAHTMEVDPGFPIPRFLLRATMRRDLTTIMEAVRARAEAGPEQRRP